MLDKLRQEDFARHVDDTFLLRPPAGEPLEVRLIETAGVGGTPADRDPFSVVFRGPAEPLLPQAIYRLEHDRLGTLDLFLVPLGPSADGMSYEAVFT